MQKKIVYADDFVKDRMHAASGIQAAIDHARSIQADEVRFGEGTYQLDEWRTIETYSIAHDDGCGDIHEKDVHLLLEGMEGITLKGSCLEDGSPGTILAGSNNLIPDTLLPSILWISGSKNITIRNLAFARNPETASSGKVVAVHGSVLTVEVFKGLPCNDGMGAYCMNRFDLADKSLQGASLTIGFGFDKRFRKTGERLLTLEDDNLAAILRVGDGVSWHQTGKTDFQLFFGDCENIRLDNVRIFNSNSFAVLTEHCRTIRAHRLVLKPREGQLFTGSRDGWKIYRCSGKIMLDECHFEGVRMDGQNVHSNFMVVETILSSRSMLCSCKYAPIPLEAGSEMEFHDGTRIVQNRIENWQITGRYPVVHTKRDSETAGAEVPGVANYITMYEISFKDDFEPFVTKGTLMTPGCWEPESYSCKNTVFRNIAGAGQLLRCSDVHIEKCTYENIMNAGILLGAELDTHSEGGHAINIVIKGCKFDNCGFKPRYGRFGGACIAIKSQGFNDPHNRNVLIEGNTFRNSSIAVEVRDASDVNIRANSYEEIMERYVIDSATTSDIRISDC